MKKLSFITFLALFGVACSSPLEKEFAKLKEESSASKSAEAEELYNKAEKFIARVEQFKNPPKGLSEKALALQQQRAREFARAVARDRNLSFGSIGKVLDALRGANLNPEFEARRVGVDPANIKPGVDPSADEVPPEWRRRNKEEER